MYKETIEKSDILRAMGILRGYDIDDGCKLI